MRNVFKILVAEPKRKRKLRRTTNRWVNIILKLMLRK
jgi:hypothetical protein